MPIQQISYLVLRYMAAASQYRRRVTKELPLPIVEPPGALTRSARARRPVTVPGTEPRRTSRERTLRGPGPTDRPMRPSCTSSWPLAAVLSLVFIGRADAQGTAPGFEETFALAPDRAKALEQLIPGSPEHYFYACLLAQHDGDLARADELLGAWRQRHGRQGGPQERIEVRQALLRSGQDSAGSYAYFVRRFGLSFDQQRKVPGAAPDLPTKLDPTTITFGAWLAEALARSGGDLGDFEDHTLERLTARQLTDARVTELLSRLRRPDVPGLAALVVRELGFAESRGFGALDIHGQLLLAQLEECLGMRPELLAETTFIEVHLRRLAPGADDDTSDPAVRAAHLDRLERFALRLAPTFDALKAHIGYHRLLLDLERDTLDAERLLTYLRVARQPAYASPELVRDKPSVQLGTEWPTGLPNVGADEPLVREYLSKLCSAEHSFERYVGALRRDYVQRVFAEAKILMGAPEPERWYTLLDDPSYYQQLRDRVELDFPRGQRRTYAPEEPVRIELDVKNVETLLVKVFEIDTLGLYEAQQRAGRMHEIDATLDLDGLVAHEEQSFQYSEPPLRRVRRVFDFPGLSQAGVYVVEFIGNGMSSRAVIRKGTLSATQRIGAAGHAFRVLDHAGAYVSDAAIRYAGREYTTDAGGEIVIPFSTDPGRRMIVLRRGDFGVLDEFDHRAEVYTLEAGIHLDREALLAGYKAQVVVRPRLSLAGERVRIDLLEGATLEISATELDGVTTSTAVRNFQLSDERESTHELMVPPRSTSITVSLRGKVAVLSTGAHVELAASTAVFPINGIDATDEVEGVLLSRTAAGYVLEVRGKNGEPSVGRAVSLDLKHNEFRPTRASSLQTDAAGRIELGVLDRIEWVRVSGVGAEATTWHLTPPLRSGAPNDVHVLAGEVVRVPYEGAESSLDRHRVSLLELRAGQPAFDRFSDVKLAGGYLEARGLPPGDHRLELRETGQVFDVRVVRGGRVGTRSHGGARRLELSRPIDLALVAAAVRGEELVVQLAGAGPHTRVHVLATRYVPGFDAHRQLALRRTTGLAVEAVVPPRCTFESGRRISAEYRYILDRRRAPKFPGNMLARGGVLLNSWAIDDSTDDAMSGDGASGDDHWESALGIGGGAGSAYGRTGVVARRPQSFVNLDFLAAPSALALNLVPDAAGVVRVPLAQLGERSVIRVIAVDDDVTLSRTVTRAEARFAGRDRRLATSLDPAKHVVEERRIELLDTGASITFDDAVHVGVETYDSLDDVFRLYLTRSGNPELAKFEFLLRWPSLSEDEKRARYSDFACHELHTFLRSKDAEFFQRVVAPYLANKADKTFLDHWLLGADLARYFEPWAFAQLNTFERILLLRGADGDAARHVRELVELLPPDTFALRTYFDAVMAGSALDTDQGELAESLVALKTLAEEKARDLAVAPSGGLAPPEEDTNPFKDTAFNDTVRRDDAAGDFFKRANVGEPLVVQDMEVEEAQGQHLGFIAEADAARALDLERRAGLRAFFRALPDTAELAERNYWRVPIASHDAGLITPTPFWLDFAASRPGMPFVSTRFPLATRNVTEMLLALALLDLPFEAAAHTTTVSGQGIVFQAGSRLLMARKGLALVRQSDDLRALSIGQDFFRLDEPFTFEGGRRRDRLVTGELIRGVPYGCRVVVTNPTSTPIEIEVLLQIPAGAIPVRSGFTTRGVPASLGAYGSVSLEYAFYFPAAGSFRHYPVHVGEDGALQAFAPAVTLGVVDAPTVIDTTSWEHISQSADVDTLLQHLAAANLARLDLARIAWRMKDRAVFERMLDFLRERFTFNATLWSFGLLHRDERATREYLEQRADLVAVSGPWLRSPLLDVDPVERHTYQQLEYDPLVNGRAHRFGAERRILNASLARQYQAFLAVLAHKPMLDAADRLALTYYLSLQDRTEEALATFAAIDASGLESRLQYDYMRAYLAFYTPDPGVARRVAEAYVDHPVQRWRARFRDVLAQLDEAEGKGAAGAQDPESRDQQQGALAASEPSLELHVEARRVTLTYANVSAAEVRYRAMDIELLFSTNPFLASGASSSVSIKPNRADTLALPQGQDTLSFDLPTEFQGDNVLVEVRAGGVVRSEAYFANDLRVQGLESYGQVAVRRATDGVPLPATYVKVYARLADGRVRFHKDGYTDVRGRFDYVSLSGMDGAEIERFAVLVMNEQHGAVVRELAPPSR
jgi:hypothetical protein